MVIIRYLEVGEEMPDMDENSRWLIVEAMPDGRFVGSGASTKLDGSWVGYGSLEKDDASLELAIAAAKAWAVNYAVPEVWVQKNV